MQTPCRVTEELNAYEVAQDRPAISFGRYVRNDDERQASREAHVKDLVDEAIVDTENDFTVDAFIECKAEFAALAECPSPVKIDGMTFENAEAAVRHQRECLNKFIAAMEKHIASYVEKTI